MMIKMLVFMHDWILSECSICIKLFQSFILHKNTSQLALITYSMNPNKHTNDERVSLINSNIDSWKFRKHLSFKIEEKRESVKTNRTNHTLIEVRDEERENEKFLTFQIKWFFWGNLWNEEWQLRTFYHFHWRKRKRKKISLGRMKWKSFTKFSFSLLLSLGL